MWRGFGLDSHCVNYLPLQAGFSFLSYSLAKLLLIGFQIKCVTDTTKDVKAARRNTNSDLCVWIKNKGKRKTKNQTLTKQNILLIQLLGNWSRKIYTECSDNTCIVHPLGFTSAFPEMRRQERICDIQRQFVCKS